MPEVELTPAQEAELAELHGLNVEIAEAERSPWQPRCISNAFAQPGKKLVLTFQRWIELDAICSPILLHKMPDDIEGIAAAMTIFGMSGEIEVTPSEAVSIVEEMIEAVDDAFATMLRMKPPEDDRTETRPDEGFGSWATLLAYLITELHFTRLEALATPVAQAFVLIAAAKHNAHWRVEGTPYRLRDLDDESVPAAPSEPRDDGAGVSEKPAESDSQPSDARG